jgi:preprotein translocase subunit SecG
MTILINFLLVAYISVALLMVLVILMQRPKSEGLGAAFGGGVTENIFGAQTTNVLVKFTSWLAGIFFVLTFVLSILYAHRSTAESGLRRELMKQQAGAQVSPSPAPGASAAQPSPVSSPAPDSGAGVASAGSASPATTAPPAASPAASAPASSANSPAPQPSAKP